MFNYLDMHIDSILRKGSTLVLFLNMWHGLNILLISKQIKNIQMDINKMTNGIFTMNGEHTQSENQHNKFWAVMQNFWNHW